MKAVSVKSSRGNQNRENNNRVSDRRSRRIVSSGTPGANAFQFIDNRPEALEHRKLRAMMDNSPQTKQMKAMQETADNSPQAKKQGQLQSMIDHSPYMAAQRQQMERMFGRTVQPKLTIGAPNDKYEREADQVADRVMRMPEPQLQQTCAGNGAAGAAAQRGEEVNAPMLQRASSGYSAMVPAVVDRELSSSGQPLDASARTIMEDRFGQDFGEVRVHAGGKAAEAATAVQARAFTLGQDIVFGSDLYAPNTKEGKRLLAHELTHTIQQTEQIRKDNDEQHGAAFNPHPIENWTDRELHDRYDFLVDYLKGKTSEIYENSRRYLREISEILSRRALAAGRTFSDARVIAMRDFFIANATSGSPQSCIDTLNQGVRNVLGDQRQKVRGEIQTTMAALQTSGRIGGSQVIEFLDTRGRRTTGIRRPERLSQSIWDTVIGMAGRDVGWSVFGLSLMDGLHSITLTLDNRNLENPLLYWSDQWSSRGGWQRFDKAGLDNEITTLTQGWWDGQPVGRKHRTRVTLWRLSQ